MPAPEAAAEMRHRELSRLNNNQRIGNPKEAIKMARMFRYIKSFGLVAVSVALIAALLVGSVVPAKAEPQKVVKIGMLCAWTGPLASIAVSVHEGQVDYIRYLNEQGGIDSIRVEARWEEFAAAVPKAITAHKRLAEWGAVLETNILDSAVGATLPRLIRDEIPCVYIAGAHSSCYMSKPMWVVGSGSEGENYCVYIVDWLKENWAEERPLKMASLCTDEPVVRAAHETIPIYAPEVAVEHVGMEIIPIFGVIDTATELLRIAAKKPDWVLVSAYGATMTVVAKDIARLGLREKGICFVGDQASLDEATLRVVGKAGEGWYKMTLEASPADVNRPGCHMMRALLDAAKRYRGRGPEEVFTPYVKGWLANMIAVEGIRVAIEQVGFENLTGHAVRDGLFSIKNFDTGLGPPQTVSEDKPFYNDYMYISHVENGKLVRITDWMEVRRVYHYVVTDGEVRAERL